MVFQVEHRASRLGRLRRGGGEGSGVFLPCCVARKRPSSATIFPVLLSRLVLLFHATSLPGRKSSSVRLSNRSRTSPVRRHALPSLTESFQCKLGSVPLTELRNCSPHSPGLRLRNCCTESQTHQPKPLGCNRQGRPLLSSGQLPCQDYNWSRCGIAVAKVV